MPCSTGAALSDLDLIDLLSAADASKHGAAVGRNAASSSMQLGTGPPLWRTAWPFKPERRLCTILGAAQEPGGGSGERSGLMACSRPEERHT
jgi:hypothetical protein